jgi:hypothetical protein
MSGNRENEPEGARLRAWERQPGEPAASFTLFCEYVGTSSLRLAVAQAAKKNGRKVPRRVSGRAWAYACRFRFRERRDAFLSHRAEQERELLETKRRAARVRRVAALEKLGLLFSARLEGMDLADVRPERVIQELVRTHEDEREEYAMPPEAEDAAPLPSLEDVGLLKPPPEQPDHEDEGRTP